MGHRLLYAFARFAGFLSRFARIGAGLTVPGHVAMRFSSDVLGRLASRRTVVLVSGTNGKTTTTRLLVAAMQLRGPVVSNGSGSNLEAGLVSALLPAPRRTTAILEVDEVVLPRAIALCRPDVVVLLNLSRDQLDRTSEVALHVDRWRAALQLSECVVVANADDPLVVSAVRGARPTSRGVVWVAAGHRWRSDVPVCPDCGHPWSIWSEPWQCGSCGSQRPQPHWSLRGDHIASDQCAVPLHMRLPGRANESNAAMAAVAANALGVSMHGAIAAMSEVQDVAGRYVQHSIGRHNVRMLLVKNPAGWMEALDERVDGRPVIMALNARPADGLDPSWLWDVPFESLNAQHVILTGERATDLSVRLHYAGVEHEVVPDLWAAIDLLPPGDCDLAANYTAFVEARRTLSQGRP